ncbi:CAMK family protein kinase [Trichomonas vaginalis G3]|uniref:CAMK family protein kinase n=1 Tax=Trichomonas vaginalis (strain ATCC PRA-98 / G3) TaxID=412133 RepID=A2G9U3_TRIV3|nr:MAP kinase kinase protein [Trichomonas vaginalis G3]EAX86075.1 CAMK family protein kinase [Trichomonas vaginalis G3]KAI5512641.1 MAP kinase kinase protein [Trichomonas vaginalis G3]|eukprot:XP_001299005.1 CAMK family protein kinase [Trichomonas vaginalis G3]
MNARDESYIKLKSLEFREVIGAGGNGVVYKVYDPMYQREFALKSIFEKKFRQNEIDCMKQVDDPNIIRLYGYDYYDGSVYLLMEYCPISLGGFLRKNPNLTDEQIKKYSIGILKAVRACHRCNIAHLDIKPGNFLIDEYDRIRVCDFGMSSIYNDNEHDFHCGGSIPFMAPEIICNRLVDPLKADIWSIGVTFFMLATGRLPWPGKDRHTLCQNSMTKAPCLEYIKDQAYAQIIKVCLNLDPDCRPTIEDLLDLPMFHETSATIIKRRENINLQMANRRKISAHRSMMICKPRINSCRIQL